jgi:peptidoglycan/LPS O-acetylase OafA/YrhL
MMVLTILVIAGVLIWLLSPDQKIDFREILMILGLVLVVGFALFLAIRRLRDTRANFPAEDEMSKAIMRKAAASSYYISIYMWLAFMFFDERINLERHTLIGAGIMGMAILFALTWIYHRYLSKSK